MGKPDWQAIMTERPQPLHLLVVEDSAWMTDSLVELIRSSSVATDIRVVDSEQEAVQLATQRDLDLIVLDLRLREGNGFNVLKRLQKQQRKPPVVVLTNYALPKYRELATLLGASEFLDKATDLEKLTSILESLSSVDGSSGSGNNPHQGEFQLS